MVLEKITQANDIKKVGKAEWSLLAEEIRAFLIDKISLSGGHLASNLGAVELTMALHLAFDLPKDKIVWDVGHQSYTHKILTGRMDGLNWPFRQTDHIHHIRQAPPRPKAWGHANLPQNLQL